MRLTLLDYGSYQADDDPGEPGTNTRRISVTATEASFLSYLAVGKTVLEIGTGLGVSTAALASTAQIVDTLDIDPWVREHVWTNLPANAHGHDRGDVDHHNYDLAFIDGRHTTDDVLADLVYALAHMDRGMIVCHDTNMPEVRDALIGPWHDVNTYHGMAIRYVGWD